jgi:hypothetical protein
MTVMLLALFFSDAALNAADVSEYRFVSDQEEIGGGVVEPRIETATPKRAWNPHLQSWPSRRAECPALFAREIEGFGILKVGPTCDPEELPYAL